MMQAAKQNHSRAQYHLGLLYMNGEGIKQDYAAAYSWFRRSADQGYAPGIYYLGKCYLNGYGVTADRESAIACFRLAADAGHSQARTELMILFPD